MEKYGQATTCCCCTPIRSGIWTLGFLGLVASVWFIVEGVIELSSEFSKIDNVWKASDGTGILLAIVIRAVKPAVGLLSLVLSILLITDVKGYKPDLLRRWVKFNLAFMIIGVASCIFLLVGTWVAQTGLVDGICVNLLASPILVWHGYYVWVVYKYAEMTGEEPGINVRPVATVYGNEKY